MTKTIDNNVLMSKHNTLWPPCRSTSVKKTECIVPTSTSIFHCFAISLFLHFYVGVTAVRTFAIASIYHSLQCRNVWLYCWQHRFKAFVHEQHSDPCIIEDVHK